MPGMKLLKTGNYLPVAGEVISQQAELVIFVAVTEVAST